MRKKGGKWVLCGKWPPEVGSEVVCDVEGWGASGHRIGSVLRVGKMLRQPNFRKGIVTLDGGTGSWYFGECCRWKRWLPLEEGGTGEGSKLEPKGKRGRRSFKTRRDADGVRRIHYDDIPF